MLLQVDMQKRQETLDKTKKDLIHKMMYKVF